MIVLFTCIEPVRVPMLKQFLFHYHSFGVEKFVITLQIAPETTAQTIDAAVTIINGHGASFDLNLQIWNGTYNDLELRRRNNEQKMLLCREDDWIVWTDSDELQLYSDSLATLIPQWEDAGYNAARGEFIDRLAPDGILAPLNPASCIWRQYPICAEVTRLLVGGDFRKVVCAKRNVDLSIGNHVVVDPGNASFPSEIVPVHHFKWDATLAERMRLRVTPEWQEKYIWWVQSATILGNLGDKNTRLSIPGIPQEFCGPPVCCGPDGVCRMRATLEN